MANDFPEKGEFVAPHIARKKPDCDKRPLLPDPCEIRPGRRKASITDFDCVSTPDKIVCPSDFVAVFEPDETVKSLPVLPPISTPGPTPPPIPDERDPLVGNEKQTASCPTSQAEADSLVCTSEDAEAIGPDAHGEWPSVGSKIIVPENSFFAETLEEANKLAAEFACSNLECCHGNKTLVGTCESVLSINDIDFLNDSGEWGSGTSDLLKGDAVTVPANSFVSCEDSLDAYEKALEAVQRVLRQTCYLCSPELFCPCPAGFDPSEGYLADECLFQGTIGETTAEELKSRAQEYIDNICQCFERPDIIIPEFPDNIEDILEDIQDVCVPEINITNPNTKNCGNTLETGTPTGKQSVDSECEFDIEFPEIPCPCGITLSTFVNNPNEKPQDQTHNPELYYFKDPGGTAGNLTSELTDCGLDLELTLPEIPLGIMPPPPQPPPPGGGGGGGGPGLDVPCPDGIKVEFCVDGKVKRTKPKKWIDPEKVNDTEPEDEENPNCQCRYCESWSGAGGFTIGQIVAVNTNNADPFNDASWMCFEVVRDIPSGKFIEPFKTPGWQNYFMSTAKKCGDSGTTCEKSKEVEVEDVPVDEQGKPVETNDEDDPCTIKIPCIDVCSQIGVSNDVVEFTSEGQTIGSIGLKKIHNPTKPGAGGDCNNCPSWTGAGGFVVGEIISEICPDGDGNCCYEVIQDVPEGTYVRPGFPDDTSNAGSPSTYYASTSVGCTEDGFPAESDGTLGSNDESCVIALDGNDLDFPVCEIFQASNDVISAFMNGKEIGSIGLQKISDGTSEPANYESWTGAGVYTVGDKVEETPFGCFEVIKNINNQENFKRPGDTAGWEEYYKEISCESGGCTFGLVGNDIYFSANDFCPEASNDSVEIRMNGKVKGTLGLITAPKINTESGDYEEIPGSCQIKLVGNDIDLTTNDFCPETSEDTININLNGKTKGSIGITTGPVISDDGDYKEIPGSCQIKLVGNDIDLSVNDFEASCPETSDKKINISFNGEQKGAIGLKSGPAITDDGSYTEIPGSCEFELVGNDINITSNDFCPQVADDYVTINLNGNHKGTIGLASTEDCKVKLTGGSIDLSVNDFEASCPEVTDDYVMVNLNGEYQGTIGLAATEDCKVKLTGGPLDLTLNDSDFCPSVTSDYVSVSLNGNHQGTIGLTTTEECEVKLTGGPLDLTLNDLDSCPEVTSDYVAVNVNGNSAGSIGLATTEDCKVKLTGGPIDVNVTANDVEFCPSVTSDYVAVSLNGNHQGSIGLTTTEECEVKLTGGPIDLTLNDSDFCPSVTSDYVAVNVNGSSAGSIGLTTTEECEVKLTGGPIDVNITANDVEFCPEVTSDYVAVNVNGNSAGSIGLGTTEDCKVKLTGGPLNIDVKANDLDFCPEVSDSQYSVDVTGPNGENYGTISLGVDGDCKLTLTGSVSIPSLYNDDDSPYEEKDIEVCTPSGNETYTILVKKSG